MKATQTGYYSVKITDGKTISESVKHLLQDEEVAGDIEYIGIKPTKLSVDECKQQVFDAIDARTQELIFKGFEFGGLRWSLSISAQINWSNIPNLPDQFFPLQMQDQNGIDYSLQLSDKMNFYLTAVNAKNQYLQSGNRLCTQVDLLTTVDDVFNFVDTR